MTSKFATEAIKASFVVLFALNTYVRAANPPSPRYKAVAFDYFVIFDPNSVAPEVERVFPGKGIEFVKAWRSKQFEYAFLRTITNDHEDFWQITADALDCTAQQMHLTLSAEARARLLNAYLTLKPWPDAVPALQRLKAAGVCIIALSNFSSTMLRANAEHAGINDLFDELVSTDESNTFKPDPKAYELATTTLHLRKDEILFAAFGGWDAYGAKRFGYTTVWVNRFNAPAEKLGALPDQTSSSIDAVVDVVLGAPQN